MNKSTTQAAARILAVAIAALLSLDTLAASRPTIPGSAAPQLTQSYVWYDGTRQQTVWMNPQIVAEFNPGKSGQSAVRTADANAKILPMKRSQAGVRMWQINNTSDAAIRGLAASHPAGKYSPVFHDSPSGSGAMRALPGNIIVYLNPAWDAAMVNSWIVQHKLELVKKLEIGPNIFVFKTAPGLEALNAANALYQSGEVVAAFPDWWKEVTTR